MILSDREISERIRKLDDLYIAPLKKMQIQPASVDLRLGPEFINTEGEKMVVDWVGWNEVARFQPGEFVLGATIERVEIPGDLCAVLHDRSSIAREGLMVQTAGFGDPGFEGQITLELYNLKNEPVEIEIGTRVCQIVFHELTSDAERRYGMEELGSRYQGQSGPVPSRRKGRK